HEVVAVAIKDVANAVTNRIAAFALRATLAAREGSLLPQIESTSLLSAGAAKQLAGRYVKQGDPEKVIELIDRNDKLFMFREETGTYVQLRAPGKALGTVNARQSAGMIHSLIVDDVLSFGEKI